jgi:hypothetical protein
MPTPTAKQIELISHHCTARTIWTLSGLAYVAKKMAIDANNALAIYACLVEEEGDAVA